LLYEKQAYVTGRLRQAIYVALKCEREVH